MSSAASRLPLPMSAAVAAPFWTAHAPPAGVAGAGAPERARQWVLRRNCSITPAQMLGVFVSVALVSAVIAVAFAMLGAPAVLAFAGLELAAVALAMLVHARHVGDRDVVTLVGGRLRIDQIRGTKCTRTEFGASWVTVTSRPGDGSVVELSGEGRSVRIGRHARAPDLARFVQDLRHALRAAPVDAPSAHFV